MTATQELRQVHHPAILDTVQDFIDAGCPPKMARYVVNPFDPEALGEAAKALRQHDVERNRMWFALIARVHAWDDLGYDPDGKEFERWLSDQLGFDDAGMARNLLRIGRNPFVLQAYVEEPITLSLALDVVHQETDLGVHRCDPPDYRKVLPVLAAGIKALRDGLPIQEQKMKVREAAASRKSW